MAEQQAQETPNESVDDNPIPREMKTPITMATETIGAAFDTFVCRLGGVLRDQGQDPEDFFFENILSKTWNDDSTNGDAEERELFQDIDRDPKEAAKFALLRAILLAVSFATQAMKAKKNSRIAWSYAASSKYWAGILRGYPPKEASDLSSISELAKLGGHGRSNRYRPVREKAYQLAKERSPESGVWPSRRQAVLAIEKDVRKYSGQIIEGGLSEQQAFITIDSWLKKMPEADTLFAGKRGT